MERDSQQELESLCVLLTLLKKKHNALPKPRLVSIDTEIKAKAPQYDFQINYLQNYESESESEIRGEVSMWT